MNQNRRFFILALGSLPLGALLLHRRALAAEPSKLDPQSAAAKALAYTHDSADPAKNCAGCQFYTGDRSGDWGPCVIFPESRVSARGLCNSWFAKAG